MYEKQHNGNRKRFKRMVRFLQKNIRGKKWIENN
tara:strand:- start:1568 stop:1669 length:102 start_codon:yes stop_codon:yes gene_type:complete